MSTRKIQIKRGMSTLLRKCVVCDERKANGYAVMAGLKNNAMYFCHDHRDRVSTLCRCANMLRVERLAGKPSLVEAYESAWGTDLDVAKFPHPSEFKK